MRHLKNLFFLLVTTMLLASCENSETELQERSKKKMGVDEATNIETFFSQAGKVKAKLTSVLMYRYQDTLPRIEFPTSLHVDFYNDSTQIESILDAKYGRYIEGQNKMYLRDSVVVIQKFNGDTLRCQELWWDQNKEKFYTDKPVRLTTKSGKIIPAQGLVASQDFRSIEFIDPADGRFTFNESEFGAATATDSTTKVNADSTKRFVRPPAAIDSTN